MNNSIVSESESDDDNSAVMQWILCRKRVMYQIILELDQEVSFRKKRRKNVKRNFEREIQKLNALFEKNDKEFKSQTSVTKPKFKYLLSLLEDSHLKLNKLQEQLAKNAYGAAIPLSLKLFMTLRILKGAKFQDLYWIGTESWTSVWASIFIPVMKVLDGKLDNLNFNHKNEDWLKETADQWAFQQKRKYGNCFWYGTLGAGDGLLLKVKPETHQSMGLSSAQPLFNRKQYHAVVAQVFCDAWTRIIIEEVCAAGVTHDSQCLRTWKNLFLKNMVLTKICIIL